MKLRTEGAIVMTIGAILLFTSLFMSLNFITNENSSLANLPTDLAAQKLIQDIVSVFAIFVFGIIFMIMGASWYGSGYVVEAIQALSPRTAYVPVQQASVQAVDKFCPKCGIKVSQGQLFCHGCGTKL